MKKGYMVYPHWWETIKKLPKEDKGELLEVMMTYINEGELLDMSFPVELVFTPILEQFKIDNEKYKKVCKQRQEAGKKGGIAKAKQKLASASKGKQKETKPRDKDNDNDNVNENEKDKENNTIVLSKDKKEINSYEENGIEKFGNKEINDTLGFLCKIVGIDEFTESQKWQRIYAKHFFNYTAKHGKDEVLTRVKGVLSDDFKRKRCNSIKVFYNEVKGYIHTPIVKSEEEERKERLDKIKQMKADLLK